MQLYQLTFEEELKVMQRYSISYELLAIVKLIFFIKENENNYELAHLYFNQCRKNGLNKNELEELKQSKILTKDSEIPESGGEINFDYIDFTDSFMKNFYKYSNQMGKELWEEFPFYIISNRTNYPIKNFSKRFKDLGELFQFYGKSINYDLEYHKLIIKSLKFAVENQLVSCNIVDYLIGRQWEQHIKQMTGKEEFQTVALQTTEVL